MQRAFIGIIRSLQSRGKDLPSALLTLPKDSFCHFRFDDAADERVADTDGPS